MTADDLPVYGSEPALVLFESTQGSNNARGMYSIVQCVGENRVMGRDQVPDERNPFCLPVVDLALERQRLAATLVAGLCLCAPLRHDLRPAGALVAGLPLGEH